MNNSNTRFRRGPEWRTRWYRNLTLSLRVIGLLLMVITMQLVIDGFTPVVMNILGEAG